MCHFQVEVDPQRFATEWGNLRQLEADGLVQLRQPAAAGEQGLVEVTPRGRHLLRTIAAVFDPIQRERARGARLV
jgi:oxygen-independent coproporphyrinogen-3 oxidase